MDKVDPLEERGNYPSASMIGRSFECQASWKMEELAALWHHQPPGGFDEDADLGTAIHEALRTDSASGLSTDEERNLFSQIRYRLNQFLEYCRTNDRDQIIKEQRFWLHDNEVVPIFSGQVDYLRISGNQALLVDIKTGWSKPSDPVSNHQLRSLAVLVQHAYPELVSITVQIISPHYTFRPYLMNRTDLRHYEYELRNILGLINVTHTPIPGDYCKHCRGILICPAMRKSVGLVKLEKEADFPLSLPDGPRGARVLTEIKQLERFIKKALEYYCVLIAKNPEAIPGWSLVPGNMVRSFKPVKSIWKDLVTLVGDEDKLLNAVSVSIEKVEKLLPEGVELPETLITWRQNRPSLQKDKKQKAPPENSGKNGVS